MSLYIVAKKKAHHNNIMYKNQYNQYNYSQKAIKRNETVKTLEYIA